MNPILLLWVLAAAPDTLHLPDLLASARATWPATDRVELIQALRAVDLAEARASHTPALTLGGLAQYQSDVTEIALPFPGGNAPVQPKDRYVLSLDLRQTLWDGGMARSQRNMTDARTAISSAELDVRLEQVERWVEEAYFSAALLGTRLQVLAAFRDELETRMRQAETRVRNGSGSQAQADTWHVEWLMAGQRHDEAERQRQAALNRLAILSGRHWVGVPVLMEPDAAVPGARPELRVFEARRRELQARHTQVRAGRMPQVAAFGTAAYGKPGLDLFSDTFKPWYVVGVQVRWSLWDQGRSARSHTRLELARRETAVAEAEARRQWELEAERWKAEIATAEAALDRDRAILELRGRLVAHMATRLDAGAATETDYLAERQAELRARLDRELHAWNLRYARHQLARTGTLQP